MSAEFMMISARFTLVLRCA